MQWQPDMIFVEKDFPVAVKEELKKMGYKISQREAIGRTELIKISNGNIEAVADNRGGDSAAGY